MAEFYLQGDKERDAGLEVSAYMDRNTPKVAKCQVNFINFICMPTYKAVGEVLERGDLVRQSTENMAYWRCEEEGAMWGEFAWVQYGFSLHI